MEESEEDVNLLPTTEPTEFQCSSCPSSFNGVEELITHCDSVHGTDQDILEIPSTPRQNNFKCDLCPASFRSKSGLNFHLRKSHTFSSSSIRRQPKAKQKDDEIHEIDIDDDEEEGESEVKPPEIVICDIESDPEIIGIKLPLLLYFF